MLKQRSAGMEVPENKAFEFVDRLSRVNDAAWSSDIVWVGRDEFTEIQRVLYIQGPAAFNLVGNHFSLLPNKKVHIQAVAVPEEKQLVAPALVVARFYRFHDDHVLKKIAQKRVTVHLGRRFYAQQVRSKANVAEIDFRRLDHLACA